MDRDNAATADSLAAKSPDALAVVTLGDPAGPAQYAPTSTPIYSFAATIAGDNAQVSS